MVKDKTKILLAIALLAVFTFVVGVILPVISLAYINNITLYYFNGKELHLYGPTVCVAVENPVRLERLYQNKLITDEETTLVDLANGLTIRAYGFINPDKVNGFYLVEKDSEPGGIGPFATLEKCLAAQKK